MDSTPRKLSYGTVEYYFDEILGIGSYGKVCKAKCGQLPCAAKLLHDTLFQHSDPGVKDLARRFEQECQFLSTIKHPNIVQYLGTSRDPRSQRPALLMELMDENLTRFLEHSIGPLPYHTQLNICHDVALALAYLHSNDIVHRDLSSNNVLLIGEGSRAKVTDFGMSKLMDVRTDTTPLTTCPGTSVYMPPEALIIPPQYSSKLDCFSHGVLTIQILTKSYPSPGPAHKYIENLTYPTRRELVEISESERRKKDINLVEPDHSLLPLALHCLKDRDTERPSADELCEELTLLKKEQNYVDSLKNKRHTVKETSTSIQDQLQGERTLDILESELEKKERIIISCHASLERERQEYEEECKSLQLTIQQVLKESQEERQNQVDIIQRLEDKLKKVESEVSRFKTGKKSQEENVEEEHVSLEQTAPGPLELTWTRVESSPEPMSSRSGSATVHDNIAYFSHGNRIYSYTPTINKWNIVVQVPYQHFSIEVVKNKLTTIGGCADSKPTNILLSLTDGLFGLKCKEIFPPMPTTRLSPASIATPTHLVVAGGRASQEMYFADNFSAVEVLDVESSQWSTACSLPCEAWSLKVTLCDGYLYFYYTNAIISCSMEKLIESCKPTFEDGGSVWTRLSDIPVHYDATLVTLRAHVVVINATGVLHCYNRETNSWSCVGKMLTPRYDVLTAVLPGHMLVVTGGNAMNCLSPSAVTEICYSSTTTL